MFCYLRILLLFFFFYLIKTTLNYEAQILCVSIMYTVQNTLYAGLFSTTKQFPENYSKEMNENTGTPQLIFAFKVVFWAFKRHVADFKLAHLPF